MSIDYCNRWDFKKLSEFDITIISKVFDDAGSRTRLALFPHHRADIAGDYANATELFRHVASLYPIN